MDIVAIYMNLISNLVKNKYKMLVWSSFFHELFDQFRTSTHGIPGVQHLYHNIRGINDFVKFAPDAPTLSNLRMSDRCYLTDIKGISSSV